MAHKGSVNTCFEGERKGGRKRRKVKGGREEEKEGEEREGGRGGR